MTRPTAIALWLILAACRTSEPPIPAADSVPATAAEPKGITDRDWDLVTIGDHPAPSGAGDKPVTLRFDPATERAAGFAGCNRYSAGYRIAGDSVGFQPAMSTKMACDKGMDLEVRYLALLADVRTFAATDSTLTLIGASGPIASFRSH